MKPFRIAVGTGALLTFALLGPGSHRMSNEPLEWLFLAIVSAAGGLFLGGFVLAWRSARRTPRAVAIVAALLAIPSAAILISWRQDYVRVAKFVATADSTRGRIRTRFIRGGVLFGVDYRVAGRDYSLLAHPAPKAAKRVEGDSIWLYYEPGSPYPAHVGRPEADDATPKFLLAETWLVGISALLGYGTALVHSIRNPGPQPGAT